MSSLHRSYAKFVFCKELRVGFFFGDSRHTVYSQREEYDVIVTSFHTRADLFADKRFHRKIIDEAHLASNPASVNTPANYTWYVTGTPFSSSLKDLDQPATRIKHWTQGIKIRSLEYSINSLDDVATALRKVMIRHTKSQRIAGDVALALPDSSTEIVWLNMNEEERSRYQNSEVRQLYGPASTFGVEMCLTNRRQVCANIGPDGLTAFGTKMDALINDINELRKAEPNMHAVVLTHFEKSFQSISAELRRHGYRVFGFSGRAPAYQRHRAIEKFQEGVNLAETGELPEPAVFVATMTIGNVGINLTAASRVYLFEPCLDPQMEAQAAGRIHRLGQTRPVLIKKLVFRDTIENNIIDLHKAIASGQITIPNGTFSVDALNILRR